MTFQFGHEAKVAWALHRLEQLAGELSAWIDENSRLTTHRFYPRSGEYVVWVTTKQLDGSGLAVEIGDCLYNLRSALDHLAYELAIAFTGEPLPKEIAENSEFPIFGDEDPKGVGGKGPALFRAAARKIAGVDPAAQAVIESLQPYQLGLDFRTHELWRLHELARVDRHRLLHLSTVQLDGMLWNPASHLNVATIGGGEGIYSHAGEIEPGQRTEVARIPATPTNPKERMYMDIKPALDVVFAADNPAAGESVSAVLGGIYNYVINDVLAALGRFV
jgi:hypothetical protein